MNLPGDRTRHLPPLSAAPILEFYDPSTRRLVPEKQIKAPTDDRGVVDIFETINQTMELVDPEYIWPKENPKPDVHHFVWERDSYHPRHFGGSQVPRAYRAIPFHMGYLPRQPHNFLHAVAAPPDVPEFEVMQYRTQSFRVAMQLFKACSLAVRVHRKPESLHGIERLDSGGLSVNDDVLKEVMLGISNRVTYQSKLIIPENEFIQFEDIEQRSLAEIAKSLGRVAGLNAVNLMPVIYGSQRSRTVV